MDHSSPPKSNTGNLGLSYMSLLDSINKNASNQYTYIRVYAALSCGDIFICVGLLYLTKLRCTPRPLCFPLHSKHMKIPYDTEAH